MAETAEKTKNGWENRVAKLAIVLIVFPIVTLVFHLLLFFAASPIGYLLVRFGRHPKFWANAFSLVAMAVALWGAFAVCKWIWPASK